MTRKRKNIFDTDNTYHKLLESLYETKTKGYEAFNIVSETGDSIDSATFKELTTEERGRTFISGDQIKDFVNQLMEERLGPSVTNKNDNY